MCHRCRRCVTQGQQRACMVRCGIQCHIGCVQLVELQVGELATLSQAVGIFVPISLHDFADALRTHIAAQVFGRLFVIGFCAATQNESTVTAILRIEFHDHLSGGARAGEEVQHDVVLARSLC